MSSRSGSKSQGKPGPGTHSSRVQPAVRVRHRSLAKWSAINRVRSEDESPGRGPAPFLSPSVSYPRTTMTSVGLTGRPRRLSPRPRFELTVTVSIAGYISCTATRIGAHDRGGSDSRRVISPVILRGGSFFATWWYLWAFRARRGGIFIVSCGDQFLLYITLSDGERRAMSNADKIAGINIE